MSNRARPSSDIEKPVTKRSQGACVECRRKRSRCDSATRPGNKCTSCEIFNIECTSTAPQRPQIQRQQEHIRILEARIKRLESYIRALSPDEDVDSIISKPPPFGKDQVHQPARTGPVSSSRMDTGTKDPITDMFTALTTLEDYSEISEADDIAHVALAEQLGRLSLTPIVAKRFFGQASPIMAAKQASTLRSQLTGVPDTGLDPKQYRRPTFWSMSPWEITYVTSPETTYVYPEFDLLLSLVSLYFEKTNSLIPILHEPTFMQALISGEHYRDPSFGMTVLLVCANGSRYSVDPRVCYAPKSQQPAMSSGWHYFSQVPIHRRIMLYTPTVYDLQYYSLAAIYLSGSSMCPVTCNLVGIGLRYATELGAHRRKGQVRPSVETELLKRAFWALFCLDAINESFYGRPSGVSHESFDVEYPVACDDEYWEHKDPEQAFKQPLEKPCAISSFVYFIKLCEILGFASRTLYSTKKSRLYSGYFGTDWEMRMVAELDSSLNKWKLSLPSHLHWDPQREDMLFFQQSAHLHSLFSYIQIQVHRPFLTKQSALTFSSLAMCTNAARSCAHIQEAAIARDLRILPHTTYMAFSAGIITVLCLWGSHRPGYVGDPQNEMDKLLRCVNVLRECEKIWHSAGALRDILSEAGALSQHDPTLDTQNFSAEVPNQTVPAPMPDLSQSTFSSPPPEISAWSNENQWDLYRLFLTEMGHREVQPTDSSNAQPGAAQTGTAQLSEPPMASDVFAFWPDVPTAFTRFGGWDTHMQNMWR